MTRRRRLAATSIAPCDERRSRLAHPGWIFGAVLAVLGGLALLVLSL